MKMRTYILAAFLVVLSFSGIDCGKNNDNVIPPDNGPDTTSHNFSFSTYEFGGQGGSSYFSDVAIINDTDIWAVGGIYTGTNPDSDYNAAHWDGKKWTLTKIPVPLCGSSYIHPFPLNAIFAFSANDIWITDGGKMIHYDGVSFNADCSINSLINGGINKIWGTSSADLYAVGNSGTILHYSSGVWTKLSSGTSLDIYDIWGATNPTTGEAEILAVASKIASSYDRTILSVHGETVKKISDTPIADALSGVWFVPEKHYYVVGSGIYEKKTLSDSLWLNNPRDITTYYTPCVRGNAVNDVFIAGSFGEFLHWNGASWKSFREQTGIQYGSFGSIAVKGNLIVTVGENLSSGALDTKGIITIARR